MPVITEAKILILATDGFEQSELMKPLQQLAEAGADVKIASPDKTREPGKIYGWDQKDWGEPVTVDLALRDVNIEEFDALVLPGGQINPDLLRVDPDAMKIVKSFLASGKTVAAVCHAPWLIIEAGAAGGRRMTSYHSIKTDVMNAGAHWVDEAVVVDKGLITSRNPGDLDAFVRKIIEEVEEGHGEQERNETLMDDALEQRNPRPAPLDNPHDLGAGGEAIRNPAPEGGVGT